MKSSVKLLLKLAKLLIGGAGAQGRVPETTRPSSGDGEPERTCGARRGSGSACRGAAEPGASAPRPLGVQPTSDRRTRVFIRWQLACNFRKLGGVI